MFGFNPTMVRLLLVEGFGRRCCGFVSIPQWCDCCQPKSPPVRQLVLVFQSHNGAIAADTLVSYDNDLLLFQSHNGAIAASCSDRESCSNGGFNPTMVRLLHVRNTRTTAKAVGFQSHNGAIAAKAKFGVLGAE